VVDTTQTLIMFVSVFVLALAAYSLAAAAVVVFMRYLRRPRPVGSPLDAARRGRG
jgi:hypothetical protein